MSRTHLALVATLVLLVAPAASARADSFCVSDTGCVLAGGSDEGANLQTALTAAENHAGPDSVQIGPGTFTSDPSGFDYDSTDPVSVTGAGPGATTLTGPDNIGIHVLTVRSSAASSISDVSVTVPGGKTHGILTTGAVSDVSVSGDSTAIESIGIELLGSGSVTHSTVDLPRGLQGGEAVFACGPGDAPVQCPGGSAVGPISDSTLFAAVPVSINGTTVPVSVDRVMARGLIGMQVGTAAAVLDDSLFLIDPSANGVGVQTSGDPPVITLDNDTIVGSGTAGSLGIRGELGDTLVRNSIITGFGTAIEREPANSVETDYSDYAGPVFEDGSGGGGTVTENNHLDVDPGFANPGAGDYSLSVTSPLVNAGDPAGPATGDSLTDLVGNPRVFGGRLDIGAYELQSLVPTPPARDTTAPAFSSVSETNKVFAVGKGATPINARKTKVGTTFRYRLSEPARVRFAIAQKLRGRKVGKACRAPSRRNKHRKRCTRFVKKGTLTRSGVAGANSLHFTGRVGRRALKPGSYRMSITATDASGNVSKAKTLSFRIVKRL